jgi:hypothetical protein
LGADLNEFVGDPPARTGAGIKEEGVCGAASSAGAPTAGRGTGVTVGAGAFGADGIVFLGTVGAPEGVVGVADGPDRTGVLIVGTVGRAGATGTSSAIAVDPPIASVASTANPFVAVIVRILPRI